MFKYNPKTKTYDEYAGPITSDLNQAANFGTDFQLTGDGNILFVGGIDYDDNSGGVGLSSVSTTIHIDRYYAFEEKEWKKKSATYIGFAMHVVYELDMITYRH